MGDERGVENGDGGQQVEEFPEFVISKEFLQVTFDKEIQSFKSKLGTNPGDNYMSVIHSAEVVFKGDPKIHYYVIKCYPSHPGRREFLDKMNIFEKELLMYSKIFPSLAKIADDCNGSEFGVKLAVPPFHAGNVASEPCEKFKDTQWASDNFIVMTDLRKINFRMADRLRGLDIDHVKLVLEQMARLHALGWAYKQKEGLKFISDKYPNMKEAMNEELKQQFTGFMETLTTNTLNMVKEKLSGDHPAYLACKTFFETDMLDTMMKFMAPHDVVENEFEKMLRVKPKDDPNYYKDPWLTIIHADCWVNNFLFRYEGEEEDAKPVEMIAVDFQASKEACPTTDIAYLLNTSVRAPLRVPFKKELLRTYYDTFIHCCKVLKIEPFPGFTFENLQRRYVRAEIFGFVIALPLLSIVLKPKEESIDMEKIDKKSNMVEMFSTVTSGSDKNTALSDEMVATVVNLYDIGVI